jgi:hypothetical protein
MGQVSFRTFRRGRRNIHQDNPYTLRIRIKTLPALRYEGFDLSSYRVGQTYEVERRLAELLMERGYAEPAMRPDRDRAGADDKKR